MAIIPARAGSRGIPNKNITLCAGKPLIDWTLQAVNESFLVTHTILSSDSGSILNRGVAYFANNPIHGTMLSRPDHLAQDNTPTEPVIGHALEWASWHLLGNPGKQVYPDIIVLLQPTSPVRTGLDIDGAITQLELGGYDSVLSAVRSHSFLWYEEAPGYAEPLNYDLELRPLRQDMAPQYEENGSIYVFTMDCWRRHHNRLGGRIGIYEMAEQTRLQIDSPLELLLVSHILEKQHVPASR